MKKRIITISREYGSGGRHIGRLVADKAGIAFYDKELIALVAKESGFSLQYIEETGEYATSTSLLFGIATTGLPGTTMAYSQQTMPLPDKIHTLQSKLIREIADKEPCVIIGRSADYILADRADCLNVFIHARMPDKLHRATTFYGLPEKGLEKRIERTDKARANHYRYYTGQAWGQYANYHLCLDSGMGIELCRDLILQAAGW